MVKLNHSVEEQNCNNEKKGRDDVSEQDLWAAVRERSHSRRGD